MIYEDTCFIHVVSEVDEDLCRKCYCNFLLFVLSTYYHTTANKVCYVVNWGHTVSWLAVGLPLFSVTSL